MTLNNLLIELVISETPKITEHKLLGNKVKLYLSLTKLFFQMKPPSDVKYFCTPAGALYPLINSLLIVKVAYLVGFQHLTNKRESGMTYGAIHYVFSHTSFISEKTIPTPIP